MIYAIILRNIWKYQKPSSSFDVSAGYDVIKVMSVERLSYDGLSPEWDVLRVAFEQLTISHAEEQTGLGVFYELS